MEKQNKNGQPDCILTSTTTTNNSHLTETAELCLPTEEAIKHPLFMVQCMVISIIQYMQVVSRFNTKRTQSIRIPSVYLFRT